MRVVLVGGSGHASDVLGAFEAVARANGEGSHSVIGIVDDGEIDERRFLSRGVRQIGAISDLASIDATHYVVSIGYSQSRQAVQKRVAQLGLPAATVIHPLADIPPDTVIGEGTVILSGARLSPLCTVGRHVYLSHGCLIGHDCIVEDFATVLPGAAISGDTVLGEACMIGTNGTVLQGVKLGTQSIVGAGAMVRKDVADGVTVVGNPARPLER